MTNPDDMHRLYREWDHWIRVVRSVESRHMFPISGFRYDCLYRRLLEACDGMEQSEKDVSPSVRNLKRKIKEVVEPWVSLETLRHSERRILRHLLAQCQSVDKAIHPHRVQVPKLIAYGIIGSLAVGMSMIGLMYVSGETSVYDAAHNALDSVQRRFRLVVGRSSLNQWLGFIALIVVLFGVGLISGARKS